MRARLWAANRPNLGKTAESLSHGDAPVCFHQVPDGKEVAMRRTPLRALVLIAALAVWLAGCGGDEDDVGDLPPPGDEAPAEPPDEEPDPTPEPTPTERVYEVQSGDTLWDIAQEFGTTVEAIVEANDLEDPDRIAPGDELVIPVDG
jgi:LysM repeat protein